MGHPLCCVKNRPWSQRARALVVEYIVECSSVIILENLIKSVFWVSGSE